jgi:hypothetical protein
LRNWTFGVTDLGEPTVFLSNDGVDVRRRIGSSSIEVEGWAIGAPTGAIGGDGYGRQFGFFGDGLIHEFNTLEDRDQFDGTIVPPAGDIEGMAYDGSSLFVSTGSATLFTLDPDTGRVVSRARAAAPWYGLAAQRLAPDESPLADVDLYTVDLSGKTGRSIDLVLSGLAADSMGATVELLDVDGETVLGTGTRAAGDAQLAIREWRVSADGVYTIRIGSTVATDYSLLISEFVLEPDVLPGDADADNDVDFADFVALANHFGQAGVDRSQGDFDGDSDVDLGDFAILANHFGQRIAQSFVPAVSSPAFAAAVDAGHAESDDDLIDTTLGLK